MRHSPRLDPLYFSFLLLLLLRSSPTFAEKKPFIVYLGEQLHGLREPSVDDLDRVTDSHYHFLGSYLGCHEKAKDVIFYSYTRHINGFAALLEDKEAAEIAKHPNVISVFLSKGRKLHTTRSWDFLGLEKDGLIPSNSLWTKARFGADAIIGNLDTGIWPESQSFSDEGMGPVPSKWRGTCQDSGVRCNRKLIGARYFNKGFAASAGAGSLNSSFYTARDHAGHGSHTLSTAGGNFVAGANVFGFGNGTAKGGSPRARVAAYKVCWPPINGNECFDADILAAFDAAISDGVDVLSVSLGGDPTDYFSDGISIGAFHATRNNIVVVCSAGNSGPSDGSVSNVSPWMMTVGASTIDREFTSYVLLGTNNKHYKGASLSPKSLPAKKFHPMISSKDAKAVNVSLIDAALCKAGTLDARKVKGKILVCIRGSIARVDKGEQALLAGAVGMILANDELSGNEIIADTHVLPASHISFSDGEAILAYINSTKSPTAYLTRVRTLMGAKPAPFMASFSSKGPNRITPEILKPDISAPGLSIIAAFSEAVGPTGQAFDKRRIQFNSQSGTSMSCPHVSGIAGLLKSLHPDWSPAAIRSAIMTTARSRDNRMKPILTSSHLKATPFSYGAGHVRPNRAMDPGLVYDLTTKDYINFLCALGYNQTVLKLFMNESYDCPKSAANLSLADFNYPSITVPNLIINGDGDGNVSITRRLKNVGPLGTYTVRVRAPTGIMIWVEPKSLNFTRKGEEQKFKVSFKANGDRVAKDYVFGELLWSDGKAHYVRSPIVVKAA